MIELWQHAISPINLPFTIILGAVVVYWLLVILGMLDMDDGHANTHADAGMHVDGDGHASGHAHSSGIFGSFMHFLHMGEVPFMVVVSLLSLFLWVGSIGVNYCYNEGGVVSKALILLVPVLVAGVVVTHFAALPFKKIFRMLDKDYDLHAPIVGSVGRVVSGEVSATFGQVVVEAKGAPITLNARVSEGSSLKKGDQALVIEEDKQNKTFKVVKYEQPKTEE